MYQSVKIVISGFVLALGTALMFSVAQAQDPDDGMMGGGMMGGGMMGGGMMGGGMMGGGMMGALSMLSLTDEQRGKINKLRDDERKQHWAVMGKMMEEQNRMRDLYQMDERDPKKIGATYSAMAKLQQQMLETHIHAQNQMLKVLTKEQRDQFEQKRRGICGARGPGMGSGGSMDMGNMRGGGMMGR